MFVVDPRGADRPAMEGSVKDAFETRDWMMDIIVSLAADFAWRRTDVGTLEYMAEREGRVLYSRPGFDAPARVRETPSDEPRSLPEWIERAQRDFRALDALVRAGRAARGLDLLSRTSGRGENAQGGPGSHADVASAPAFADGPARSLSRIAPTHCGGVADACAVLDGVFPKTRYPDDPIPTAEEVDAAVTAARLVREAARIAGVIV